MSDLREIFLETLRANHVSGGSPRTAGKILLAKSVAPELITVRNNRGEVLGFGSPERVSQSEAMRLANLGSPNDCFGDNWFLSASCLAPIGVEVQKSAEKEISNDIFDQFFPL